MALAVVDEARAKGYRHGVVGLRGLPAATAEATVTHDGQQVQIRVAESALAAREVLLDAPRNGWLALVTDRPEDDLGAGILAHLVWARLRNPYPWDAVRASFAATGLDTALVAMPHDREVAAAVLTAAPDGGWPAAPAGMLTRAHLLRSVAEAHLGLPPEAVDVTGVLRWATAPDSTRRLLTARTRCGDLLTDTVLAWIAQTTGSAGTIIGRLLADGALTDIAATGLVLATLTGAAGEPAAAVAAARLAERLHVSDVTGGGARSLATAAVATVTDDLLEPTHAPAARAVLARAERILRDIGAASLAAASDILPAGLHTRAHALADAIRAHATSPDLASLVAVSAAWRRLQEHRDPTPVARALQPLEAAIRLCRWLVLPSTDPGTGADADMARLTHTHLREWSWADAAINDAATGVEDPDLASALQQVIAAALARRVDLDRAFATALAGVTSRQDGHPTSLVLDDEHARTLYLEDVLPDVVIPHARAHPTLLVVLDGMSAASANEVVTDTVDRLGFAEAGLSGTTRRSAALAVLPSLTEVSRTSLLTGRLARGDQSTERRGYTDLLSAKGIRGAIFHKKDLETRDAGSSIARAVAAAIDDTDLQLVSVVLNTIDDALDRSDPGGTAWTTDAVKHLAPLLDRARTVGRTVIMTADHGHVVERRTGQMRSYARITSARSREAMEPPADGEILVEGGRVIGDDRRAVLAVDEGLRFGPLKAGYHGGASASEVVVPVIALVPDTTAPSITANISADISTEDGASAGTAHGLTLLAPQAPLWWYSDTDTTLATETSTAALTQAPCVPVGTSTLEAAGTLFAPAEPTEPAPPVAGGSSTGPRGQLGRAVVDSEAFAAQVALTGRTTLPPEAVARFIDQAAAVPGGRLARPAAAVALGIPTARLHGAIAQLAKLLNIEGYGVVRTDPATGAVEVDLQLLREQFEVTE